MKQIHVFTGKVHSGKTTRLMQWAALHKNIDGIFQPVIDERRFIYHISSRLLKILETEDTNNIIEIGKYKFSNQAFDWANKILVDCCSKELDWIIVDEIGPLELAGKALAPAVQKIFSANEKINANILCVVREEILSEFLDHYNLQNNYRLFDQA